MIKKIISGGQTGADMGGLLAAKELGIETGGWVTFGNLTEDGYKPELISEYNLSELPAMSENSSSLYKERTRQNILNSDGTLILADKIYSPGTRLTIGLCNTFDKLFLLNPSKEKFLWWLNRGGIEILNVAGNRESVAPGIQEYTRKFLVEVLSDRKI